jgi:ABC-type nickel/cobalt efflux system permease component RcnA
LQKIIFRDDLGNTIYQDIDALFVFRLAVLETQVTATPPEPTFDWIANTKLMAVGQNKTVPALSGQTDSPKNQDPPKTAVHTETSKPQASAVAELSSKDDGTGVLDRMFGRVTGMIRAKELTTAMFVSGLLIAMILGMAHAWSPGHGKTVMAAYLIGERGTVWNAIVLGIVVTITHTWSVLALGVVTLYTQERISSQQLNFWLSFTSGGIIVAIGLTLFFRRYAAFILVRHGKKSEYSHHSHDHDHHGHSHVVKTDDGSPPSIWSILGLGFSGGIVPCPSALIVLLLAIQFKRLAYGLWLILSFSLGLALVLVVIGIIVVRAAGVVRKATGGGATLAILPVISSVLITILGIALLVGTLVQYGFLVISPMMSLLGWETLFTIMTDSSYS